MCSRRLCASTVASTADAVVYHSCAPAPPHGVRACPGLGCSKARCILHCPCLRLDTCFWPRHTWTHHGECLVRTVCWKLCNPHVLTHTLCCELQGAHCLSARACLRSMKPSLARSTHEIEQASSAGSFVDWPSGARLFALGKWRRSRMLPWSRKEACATHSPHSTSHRTRQDLKCAARHTSQKINTHSVALLAAWWLHLQPLCPRPLAVQTNRR
jgi:hypothetical protein